MRLNTTRGFISANGRTPYGQWLQGLIDSNAINPRDTLDREKLDDSFFNATRHKVPRVSWYAIGYCQGCGINSDL